MQTRRSILKTGARLALWCITMAGLGLFKAPTVFAEIKKRILPKGTDPQSLKTTNPASLDTRNLDVMPLEAFGIMGDKNYPFNPDTWRLEVTGAVETPIALSYDQILHFPVIERDVLLVCPGVFVNHGRWKGFSIRELIHRVSLKNTVSSIRVYGHSRFGDRMETFHIDEATSDKVFLAYAVNDTPLPAKHGYPLRIVAEGHWGSHWAKYVKKIEFAESDTGQTRNLPAENLDSGRRRGVRKRMLAVGSGSGTPGC